MEKEVVILSTTVTSGGGGGFAADAQRLNVALTRAKRHLLLVGSADAMGRASHVFADILQHCR